MKAKLLVAAIAFIFLVSCDSKKQEKEQNQEVSTMESNAADQSSVKIYNVADSSDLQEIMSKDLDSTHPNLLNPQVSQDSIQQVVSSWTQLHQALGNSLAESNFNWETQDSVVKVFHKIYFNPNGSIKEHAYNILSNNISFEKKEAFGEILKEFDQSYQIDISRAQAFAQCGKAAYSNNTNP